MKLFLDIASGFLTEKSDYYRKKTFFYIGISAILWILAGLIPYSLFLLALPKPAFFAAAGLLFAAVLTSLIAKENHIKARIYSQIFEDLQEVRELANVKVEEMERSGR